MSPATAATPPVIDAHVHFWDPRVLTYPWLASAAQLNRPRLWRAMISTLARRGNVVCKLSGLATEAAPGTPGRELVGLLRDALDAFGPDRCMYGSDWPVMTLATTCPAWFGLVQEALDRLGADAAEAVLSGTATRVYAPAREGAAASQPL